MSSRYFVVSLLLAGASGLPAQAQVLPAGATSQPTAESTLPTLTRGGVPASRISSSGHVAPKPGVAKSATDLLVTAPVAPEQAPPATQSQAQRPTALPSIQRPARPEAPAEKTAAATALRQKQEKEKEAQAAREEAELLAQLDSELGEASTRLDSAESKLSQGQRQLSGFTGVLQQAMLEMGADARGLNPFVKVAQRYLGTPYVWGGVSGRGFDCSGFIIRVMRDLGYRALPHSAADQFRYGIPVSSPLLKPGDLVFFANTYKPGVSHVGIYLGRRRFIHAANSNVGTIVSSLEEPKWKEKYAGARRLVPVKRS